MDFPDHPFWDFSIEVHQRPGVHEACLDLQTRYALDVNILFFCCWVGAAGGGPLELTQIESAIEIVEGWQEEVVRPIWKARWRLKPSYKNFPTEWTESLRQALIKAELDAEHMEQLHLADTIVFANSLNLSEDIKAVHVVANIFLYLNIFSDNNKRMQLNKDDITGPLLTLVAACFPAQDKQRLKALIEKQSC
jgi:uncharacterized protein (TIGR02444 family)